MQRPGCPPVAVHRPEQQSLPAMQMSPGAWHVYAGMHTPPWQFREQHSRPPAQASPRVLQVKPLVPAGSDAQVPLAESRMPVQHCDAEVAGEPVGVHCVPEQRPPTQLTEQQSPSLAHVAPACLQNSEEVHFPLEHTVEQHCEPLEHVAPESPHAGGGGAAQ